MPQCSPASSIFERTAEDVVNEEQFAAIAKALAHPARVRIVAILTELETRNGCLNSDLVTELGLAQSTVSEHLRILKKAKLITAEPQPPRMCYRINSEQLARFSTLLAKIQAP
ncbi:ArsR/SmtB family transcription factor [Corallincola platygyrae]|uniref:ArsR/SmtB family transcription factor n=1 Tax=Corallincola platygyrae TaxID=1193278 RepID=A0ABW4XTG7_9GAMM